MNDSDEPTPQTAAEQQSSMEDDRNRGPRRSTATSPLADSNLRTWVIAMAAGLLAGVLGGVISEAELTPTLDGGARAYDYTQKRVPLAEAVKNPDSRLAREQGNLGGLSPAATLGLRNAVVSYGTMGAALGLCLGLAGGLIRGSLFRGVLAAATGLVLGGAAGSLMARLLAPVVYKNLSVDDLTYSLMVHAGIWGTLGAGAGMAFGLGLEGWGRVLRLAVAGAGGAFLAAAVYEVAGGILAPRALTNLPVSMTWQTRTAAHLLVTLLVAVGVVLAARSDGTKRPGAEAMRSGGSTTTTVP